MSRETDGDGWRAPNGVPFGVPATLADVQRLGISTASEVIEGFVELLGAGRAAGPGAPDAGPATGPEPGFRQLRVNVARALDLYTELVRRCFEGYADLVEQTLRAGGTPGATPGDDDAGTEPLTLRAAAGTTRVAGPVWIHNSTDRPAAAVLRLTDLTAHDGHRVPSVRGRFEPPAVTIAAGASGSVRVEVALDGVPAGVYHGHVMAHGLPEVALAVRLVVADPIADGGPGPPR